MNKLTYERAKQLYMPYGVDQMRHLCALRDVEIERLRAENDKLREKLTASPQCETCEAMLDCDECLRANESVKERKRLDSENAKLKELAKLMHDHINECCNACGERCICDIDALTRELGIEVYE